MKDRDSSIELTAASGQFIKESGYWLKQFNGPLDRAFFPYDRYDDSQPRDKTAAVRERFPVLEQYCFDFPDDISTRIRKISGGSHIRLHMILVSGLAVLLHKSMYNAPADFVVGMPIYRQDSGERFVNTVLPVKIGLREGMSFKDVLLSVRKTVTEAAEHQNYPMEVLVKQLNLPAAPGEFPLFDVALLLENIHHIDYLRSVPLRMIFSFNAPDNENGGPLTGIVSYDPSRYSHPVVEKLSGYFLNLLQNASSDLDCDIALLDMITVEEKKRILETYNRSGQAFDSQSAFPDDRLLHRVFEDRAAEFPDRIAAVFRHRCITYAELNRQANILARLLRERGVGEDTLVALVLDPSIETVAAILGVLKAGGAYLPLDGDLPPARIESILEDSGVSLVVTHETIFRRHSYTSLQGLTHRRRTPYLTPRRQQILDFDNLPIPDRSLVNYEKYNKYIGHNLVGNCISIQATRGCPYNCAYCHKIWPKSHVYRSAENIFEEVMISYNAGVRRFSFVDDIFNLNRENSRRFFQLVIDSGIEIQLFYLMRGDILTRDYIDLMIEAGVVRLGLALETGCPRLQTLIRKNLKIDKLKENMEYISATYPQVILELYTMHGFPTETEEEAGMTLDFIKSIKWIHFPYIFILVVYPDTDMEKLALENGVPAEAIANSINRAYHEMPETLPFERAFTVGYQADLLENYFFKKERLLQVLPAQMRILTESEMLQKYNSYLPVEITSFDNLLEVLGVTRDQLGDAQFLDESKVFVPDLNRKNAEVFRRDLPPGLPREQRLRVLLLDLSQNFSTVNQQLDDHVEPPLGLMYLMTDLNHRFAGQISGKIAKAMIDFDSFEELKALIDQFEPQLIGIRTLSLYKEFFHDSVARLKMWNPSVPVITGGPYATSSYRTILQDPHVDAVVMGEGEITLREIVAGMLENGRRWLDEKMLKGIESIAFIPGRERESRAAARHIIPLSDRGLEAFTQSARDSFADNPEPVNVSHHLAYSIFTSGSTGLPKGVLIEHRNVNRLMAGLRDRVYSRYPGARDRSVTVGLVAPYIFDASVKQIFAALLQGHVLAVIPEDVRGDGPALIHYIKKHLIQLTDGTPLLVRLMTEAITSGLVQGGPPRHLQHLLIGGEALLPEVVEAFIALWEKSPPRITNVYGPTEATVDTAVFDVIPGTGSVDGALPIGKPLPYDRVYILDRYRRPVPEGLPGELCIGGLKLARGYLNRPELTAEKFVCIDDLTPSSEKTEKGTGRKKLSVIHLYRTGDLARFLPGGDIQFLGRIDQQVKIRGFRIEPGEIEARLKALPVVKDAVVAFREHGNRDNMLAAYVVPVSPAEGLLSMCRRKLERVLPDYMIPGQWVELESLPITRGGKIDRKALPEPGGDSSGTPYSPPETPTEILLTDIWADLLGMDKKIVGVTTGFFQLGGHSLTAMQLIARIHKSLDVRLALTELFQKPTIRVLARHIDRQLRETGGISFASITPAEQKEYYPLSSAQQRLYVISRMEAVGVAYNMPRFVPLAPRIDISRLRDVFHTLIRHHESLRTSFIMVDQAPVQRVLTGDWSFDVREVHIDDGRDLTAACRDFVQPFDLSSAPLLRAQVIYTDDSKILAVDMHHIISDGVSDRLLESEVKTLLKGGSLSRLPIQYKDYACWQQWQKQRDGFQSQENFWLSRFEGDVPVLNLPLNYPRPPVQGFDGHFLTFSLDTAAARGLKALAERSGATLYMAVLALFNLMLSRLSGGGDIVVGTPVAGRSHADLEKIIGLFVNALPLRNRVDEHGSFTAFLNQVKSSTLEAFENQDYPFEELVDKLSINRDISRNPLFDIMFSFNADIFAGPSPDENPESGSPKFSDSIAKFDLTFTAHETGDGIACYFQYAKGLYKRETVTRWTRYFQCLAREVVNAPACPMTQLEMLPEREKMRLLHSFNLDRQDFPEDKTMVQLFREQAAKTPDSNALADLSGDRFPEEQGTGAVMTYRQLEETSDRLAAYLIGNGFQFQTVAALLVEPSNHMIVAILAILKSGGIYLPVDSHAPGERICYILSDSSAKRILTTRDLIEKENISAALDGNRPETVFIEEAIECAQPVSTFPAPDPLSAAYVVYTSGTSGRPKGVCVTHANISPLLHWGYRSIGLGTRDRAVQNLSYYFDWSIWEIFIVITSGASLYFFPRRVLLNPEVSIDYINRNRITVLHATPTQFQYYLDTSKPLETLKYLCLGAEKLKIDTVSRSFRAVPSGCRVFNMYGPTEATIIAAVAEIKSDHVHLYRQQGLSSIPIGNTAGNNSLIVLDRYFNPSPVNVPGELYIGGTGTACGYLNNPELTVENFLPENIEAETEKGTGQKIHLRRYSEGGQRDSAAGHNTPPDRPRQIFYKTGDLVRWLEDGSVEFLGRIDDQVKIRGYRIEPGEIESRILEHSFVNEVAVLEKRYENGDNYLCAYVVLEPGQGVGFEKALIDLRKSLGGSLPEYMIPAAFIHLDQMPLNANGKLDRNVLPEPGAVDGTLFVAPRDEIEKGLARIWANVLQIPEDTIGIHHNFFQVGGHSLKATMMCAAIEKTFQVSVPLTQFFILPTIGELAEYIGGSAEERFLSVPVAEKQDAYVLSSAQLRLYVLHQMTPRGTAYNLPYTVSLGPGIDTGRLQEVFEALILRHESLRTSFHMSELTPVQRIQPGSGDFCVQHVQLGHPEDVHDYIARFVRPFDLDRAPLIRAALIEIPEASPLLTIDMHHIISDGVSRQVLEKEFTAIMAGQPLPPLRIQYKDYAVWQHDSKRKGMHDKQENYWLGCFAGEVPVVRLPLDYHRPTYQSFQGGDIGFVLDSGLTQSLNRIASQHGATLYMILLTIFNVFIYKITRQTDLVVGTPVSGRSHADFQAVIGLFVNTLALRSRVPAGEPFLLFLDQVKTTALQAFENQDYPFEELVEKILVKRDMSRNPLFDVMFSFHTPDGAGSSVEPPRDTTPGGIRVTLPGETASKFDMTFNASYTGDTIACSFRYAAKLFLPDSVQRWVFYFQRIARAIADNPHGSISDIDFLSPEDKDTVLHTFNRTDTDFPSRQTLHQLFEEQVRKTPGSIALRFPENRDEAEAPVLTYRELNEKADLAAGYLIEKGFEPGMIAALLLERSFEMIIGILAVLKAGGAYLPVSPDAPAERIKLILADSAAKFLITAGNPWEKLNSDSNGPGTVIQIDDIPASSNRFAASPSRSISPSSPAYVIYTSGTTGIPKGVVMEHTGAVNVTSCFARSYGIETGVNVLLMSDYTFDASVDQIFGTLLHGGTLHVVPGELLLDVRGMRSYIGSNAINVINFVPRYLMELLGHQPRLESITAVISGAEPLENHVKDHLLSIGYDLYNHYGPTETAIYALSSHCSEGSVTLGTPIANTRCYLLDPHGNPVPVGVPGEIYISGAGVARGYLNRPMLTMEKFVTSEDLNRNDVCERKPFIDQRSSVINFYRTGDLGCWLPNGEIRFLGRMDEQVKIRGFRIEPGEIDYCIQKHPSVKESVVVDQVDDRGERFLCAYIVYSEEPVEKPDFREFLLAMLPGYMIPSVFVTLESIPLTGGGKIDRQVLPEPGLPVEDNIVPPSNKTEERLVAIWSDILGLPAENIGVTIDFFRLGGHSLRATQVADRITREWGIRVPLAEFFKTPYIRSLALYIDTRLPGPGENGEVADSRDENVVHLKKGNGLNLFLVHDGTGEVDGYLELCSALDPAVNCWGLKSERLAGMAPLDITIGDLADSYIEHMKRIQPRGPYTVAGWSFGGTVAFEMARRLEENGETVHALIQIDTVPPGIQDTGRPDFDLETERRFIIDSLQGVPIEDALLGITCLEQLWPAAIEYLVEYDFDIRRLRSLITGFGIQAVPNFQHLGIPELLYYFNVGRMFRKARLSYVPSGKITGPAFFFKAGESVYNPVEWNDYFQTVPSVREIPGDHFSMVKEPNVRVIAQQLNRLLVK